MVQQRGEVEYMRRNRAAFDEALKEPPLPRDLNWDDELLKSLGQLDDFADQDWANFDEH